MTVCDARGQHEGSLVYTNPTNDGALYRCPCGEERWQFYFMWQPPTITWPVER